MTHHGTHPHHHVASSVLEVTLTTCPNGSDLDTAERALTGLPGVTGVHLDRTRSVAHVSYDHQRTDDSVLREQIARAGYACTCRDCQPSAAQPGHPQAGHAHGEGPEHREHPEHHGDGAPASLITVPPRPTGAMTVTPGTLNTRVTVRPWCGTCCGASWSASC
ncbi:heavy-metal-associated domain-containing protein [Deinococcus aquaticus]|uniref:heavy-metal-associated domain-containing protein n=1 Tax=Deinococcus aquaticus TaxID=328692 RepID=UPI00361A8089